MSSISGFLRKNGLLHAATTKPGDYNFLDQVVQFDDDPNRVASGEATIIFSGPPVYLKVPGTTGIVDVTSFANYLVPIGAVQGFQENETPNIQPFPEVGSRLKRMAVGMANYQVSISRVITYHSNLRNALYAWLAKGTPELQAKADGGGIEYRIAPGRKNASNQGDGHMITSESEITRLPFGILLATMTAGGDVVTQEYFEKCYIQNIGKAVQAGSGLIQENVGLFVTRKVAADIQIAATAAPTNRYIVKDGQGS